MKSKKICVLLALLLMLTALPASAVSTQGQSWYFKPNGHEQPELLGGSPLVRQYDLLALGDPTEKVVYLTFDAGYDNGNVEKVLDVLQKHGAPGAFFILPGLLKNSPATVLRMANEGHTVCNHTTHHRDLSGITDPETFRAELQGVEDAYRELTGKTLAKYLRPPEGRFSERTLALCRENGYRCVFWSFAYADWDNAKQPDRAFAKQKLLANLHPGEVLLLHPTSETNAAILDEVLTEMEAQGYRFGTLDQLASAETLSVEEYRRQGLIFSGNPNASDCIALTFDDGPHPTQTDEILAVLQKYNVKATFFPIGKNIELCPEAEQRVLQAGHEIGNHTYSHAAVSKLDRDSLEREIRRTNDLLEQLGAEPTVFRPPGGDVSDGAVRLVNDMGYRYVLWSWQVDTLDWAAVSTERVVDKVLSNVKGGDIVLFHDYVVGKSPTAQALEILLPELLARGYRFVTVSELASA